MGLVFRWFAVALLGGSMAACSSGGHPAGTATPANPLPSVAASLGCHYKPYGPPEELYTLESGDCGQLTLYWFASATARDQWLAAVDGTAIVVKRGPTWLAVRE